MRTNKCLEYAIKFAQFSRDFGIPPEVLGELISLNKKKVQLPSHKQLERKELIVLINDLASQHSCSVDWGGESEDYGWPMIQLGGRFRDLPAYP